jgi:hypothetical protein
MGTGRLIGHAAFGPAFEEKDQQIQSKGEYGGGQYKNKFRH